MALTADEMFQKAFQEDVCIITPRYRTFKDRIPLALRMRAAAASDVHTLSSCIGKPRCIAPKQGLRQKPPTCTKYPILLDFLQRLNKVCTVVLLLQDEGKSYDQFGLIFSFSKRDD